MFLVENERVKLTASWLNALATALVAAGAFAPAAAWLYGLSALPIAPAFLSTLAGACLIGGISLHLLGLAILGRLRE
jgi:ABC-type xylose transport system permease subunit